MMDWPPFRSILLSMTCSNMVSSFLLFFFAAKLEARMMMRGDYDSSLRLLHTRTVVTISFFFFHFRVQGHHSFRPRNGQVRKGKSECVRRERENHWGCRYDRGRKMRWVRKEEGAKRVNVARQSVSACLSSLRFDTLFRWEHNFTRRVISNSD